MNRNTRDFINLILEKDEKENKNDKKNKPKSSKDQGSKSTIGDEREVLKAETDNTLSKGRPITDAGLANMKYRSNGTPKEAKDMLDELGVQKSSGSTWHASLAKLFNSAAAGEMGALIDEAVLVKSSKNQDGVHLTLKSQWKEDDKAGKRSFGFIRALLSAANKAGYLSANSTIVKNLRVERVKGQDSFIIYVSNKATNWGV